MNYKHYKRLKALGFPLNNFSKHMHLKWSYIKKLNDNNIFKVVEKEYKIKIPNNLKKLIIKYNAGDPTPNVFDTNKAKERVFGSLISYNKEDKLNIFFVLDDFNHKNLLPFAFDVAGNIICIDIKDNTIKLVEHETNDIEFVANSLEEFMNSLYE